MTPQLPLAFMSFGFGELLIIGTVALLVFGGQLPDVMRNLGRAYARLKEGLNEVSKPVREELRDVRSMPDPRQEVQSALSEVHKPLDQPDDAEDEYALSNGEEGEPRPWPGEAAEGEAPAAASPSPPPRFEEDDDEPLPP